MLFLFRFIIKIKYKLFVDYVMINRTTRNILSIGGLTLVIIYFFLKGIILAALLIGLVPMTLIFGILMSLKYTFKISKLKNKSSMDILSISIGLGASVGLILIILVKMFYSGF